MTKHLMHWKFAVQTFDYVAREHCVFPILVLFLYTFAGPWDLYFTKLILTKVTSSITTTEIRVAVSSTIIVLSIFVLIGIPHHTVLMVVGNSRLSSLPRGAISSCLSLLRLGVYFFVSNSFRLLGAELRSRDTVAILFLLAAFCCGLVTFAGKSIIRNLSSLIQEEESNRRSPDIRISFETPSATSLARLEASKPTTLQHVQQKHDFSSNV